MEYTKEQIERLPAGMELDALVGEYVLGYKRLMTDGQVHLLHPKEVPALLRHGWEETDKPGPVEFWGARFSTDIAAAWQVVEKMGAKRVEYRRFELTQYESARAGNTLVFLAAFAVDDYAEAPSAPLAICRAALLAVLKGGADASH